VNQHGYEFRKLSLPRDRAIVRRLHEEYDDEYGFRRAPEDYDRLLDYFESHAEIYHLFALFAGAEPLGYIRAYDRMSTSSCDRVLMFDTLHIRRGHRGKGLGKIMMEGLLDFAAANGNARIDLLVDIDNEPAQRLYRRYGFTGRKRIQMVRFLKRHEDLETYFAEKRAREEAYES